MNVGRARALAEGEIVVDVAERPRSICAWRFARVCGHVGGMIITRRAQPRKT
jgi:hypothetical protein